MCGAVCGSCYTNMFMDHVESQENKKLCFYATSLALNLYLVEACHAKRKLFIPLRLNMAAELSIETVPGCQREKDAFFSTLILESSRAIL